MGFLQSALWKGIYCQQTNWKIPWKDNIKHTLDNPARILLVIFLKGGVASERRKRGGGEVDSKGEIE